MTDHIERMVQAWFARLATATATGTGSEGQGGDGPSDGAQQHVPQALKELVGSIHRLIREAENDTRVRCEEIAVNEAGDELGGRIALAIRTADPESLPRKSLTEIYAPDLRL
jgi:hypothetical protein